MQKWALFLIKVFCQEYLLKTFLQNNCLLNNKIIIFIELRTIIATSKPIRMLIFYQIQRILQNYGVGRPAWCHRMRRKMFRQVRQSPKNTFVTEIIKSLRKMTEYDHFDFERVKTRMKTIDCWAVCHLFSFLIRKFILYLGLTLGIE